MKNSHLLIGMALIFSMLFMQDTNAQSNASVAEVNKLVNGNHLLITYREGEVLYGTYYFIEVHYCLNGTYGLYGKTTKKTVMGNEQNNSWQEFGTWKTIEFNGKVGVYYKTTTLQEKFVPVYRLADGSLSIGQGISITNQGKALCN